MKRIEIIIGIDPGANTGFAVWNTLFKDFTCIKTLTFWECIDKINELSACVLSIEKQKQYREYGAGMVPITLDIGVKIEDPNLNTFFYDRHKTKPFQNRIAQNVGMNKRDAQLIIEYCQNNKIPVFPCKPTKYSRTGMKADAFKEETGWNQSTSEHGRDAAMLVFKHEPIIIR